MRLYITLPFLVVFVVFIFYFLLTRCDIHGFCDGLVFLKFHLCISFSYLKKAFSLFLILIHGIASFSSSFIFIFHLLPFQFVSNKFLANLLSSRRALSGLFVCLHECFHWVCLFKDKRNFIRLKTF